MYDTWGVVSRRRATKGSDVCVGHSPTFLPMHTFTFDTFIEDGRIDFPQVPVVFIPYRSERDEASLHLNDTLYRNHALYHAAHDECPATDILTSWAYRGMEGMRSYGHFDRYDIERVSPERIVERFVKDLDRIHRKLDLTDKIDRKRERGRVRAVKTNNRNYRHRLAQTLIRLRQGLSYSQVVSALGISLRTVKRHAKALKGMGKSWAKQATDKVKSAGVTSISPPIHVTSKSGISSGSEQAKTPRRYGKLSQWRSVITSLTCPDETWQWFLESIHPAEYADAEKLRSEALAWQRLLDEHDALEERLRLSRLERERHDTGTSYRYQSLEWTENVFGVA